MKKADNRLIISFLLGAENETRTRDPNLGKVVLYQLSYFRKCGSKGNEKNSINQISASLCQGCSMIQADLFLHAAYTIFVPMKTPRRYMGGIGCTPLFVRTGCCEP